MVNVLHAGVGRLSTRLLALLGHQVVDALVHKVKTMRHKVVGVILPDLIQVQVLLHLPLLRVQLSQVIDIKLRIFA